MEEIIEILENRSLHLLDGNIYYQNILSFLEKVQETKKYLENYEVLKYSDELAFILNTTNSELVKILIEIRLMKSLFPYLNKVEKSKRYSDAYNIIKDMTKVEIFTSIDKTVANSIILLGGKPGYTMEYINIYNREKNMRNLIGFENLIELPDTIPEIERFLENASSVPKHISIESIKTPYNPDPSFFEDLNLNYFKPEHLKNLVIAGGSVIGHIKGIFFNDYDFFFYGCSEKKARKIIEYFIKKVDKKGNLKNIYCNEHAINVGVKSDCVTMTYQFILRIYPSPSQIVHGFDVDCSCALFDLNTEKFYITERCMYALKYMQNTFNFEKMSPSYEYRILKNSKRGFSVYIPLYEEYMNKFPLGETFREKGIAIFLRGILSDIFGKYPNSEKNFSKSFYDKELSKFNGVNELNFIIENPDKQATGMFHQLVLENRETWYIPQLKLELNEYKSRRIIKSQALDPEPYNLFRDIINSSILIPNSTKNTEYFCVGNYVTWIYRGQKLGGPLIIGRISENNEEDYNEDFIETLKEVFKFNYEQILEISINGEDFYDFEIHDYYPGYPKILLFKKKFSNNEEILDHLANSKYFYDFEQILMKSSTEEPYGEFYFYDGYERNILERFHDSSEKTITPKVFTAKILSDDVGFKV